VGKTKKGLKLVVQRVHDEKKKGFEAVVKGSRTTGLNIEEFGNTIGKKGKPRQQGLRRGKCS